MFNVLPDSFKEKIIGQYKKRYSIVWLAVIITLQIGFLISLLPSYIQLLAQENAISTANMAALANATSTPQTIKIFQTLQGELSVLSTRTPSHGPDFLIAHLISLKGGAITFTEITYQDRTATSSTITLSGIASTRDSLLTFSKKIQADSMFENVNLPVSNFAKDKNIQFSISLNGDI